MKTQALILTFSLCVGVLHAQQIITGTVTSNGEPLIGANVFVENSIIGTVTDPDGTYRLEIPTDATALLITYVGFEPRTVPISGRSVVDVEMQEGLLIDEIIVTGYASRKRSELVGSAVQIKSEALEQVPVASVDQVLQGRVAGLTISATSGTPGSLQDIRIRGISSINAGNSPLYVVDGVPVLMSQWRSGAVSSLSVLSSINPNDIASITVLKDASATAAYGARGSNGVIVITTKKGKVGKTSFDVSASYGISNDAIAGPVMLTAAEREILYYEALYNTYGVSEGFDRSEAKAYYEANPDVFGTAYTDWNAAGRPEGNWADVITNKNAPQYELNLSIAGGDDKENFYASLGMYDAEATVIGADFQRISGSLKYSRSLCDKLRFDTKNYVSYSEQDGLLEGSAYYGSPRAAKYFIPPLAQPYNTDGSINIKDINNYTSHYNPLWIETHDIDLIKATGFISNTSLSWDTPVPGLNFTTRMNIQYGVGDNKSHNNRVHGDGVSVGGSTNVINFITSVFDFQNSLNYSLNISQGHHVELIALQEFQKFNYSYLTAGGIGFSTDDLTNLASASTPRLAYSSFQDQAIASYTGMLNYDYDSKYILSLTYRREGNSVFPRDHRWGNFWSAGVAWNIHQESFMRDWSWLSDLKLRASYGTTGNDNIGLNQYQALFGFSGAYGGAGAISPVSVGNEMLSWERADNFEAGVDFGLFQNRLNGVFSYFHRETKENLLQVPLSRTTGFASQLQNIGRMVNKGVELELDLSVIRSNNFNLSLGGNIATVHNEVLELPVDGNGDEINITTGTRRVETDHIVWEWYLVEYAGVDPENGESLYYLNGEGSGTTSDFSAAERIFIGKSALPTLTAGFNIHFDFKGIFLDVLAYYAGGHMVYEDWANYTRSSGRYSFDTDNGINSILDRWQQPGDITNTPKVTYDIEPFRSHTRFLYDGDYIRLRDVTIGYTIPQHLTNRMKVQNLRVFARGFNLLTWVKDDRLEYDPEVATAGFTGLATPPVKTIMFGINLKL